ncbi:MAG: hypothetical protein L6R38_008379 [Xanthoria sp. 2 TBL-2021]|nr:MAG: hypothetical protein L6R38_008379 [Xanthoria sp. 2 TBL-2021]
MKTPPTPVSPASFNIYFRLDRIIDEYSSMTTIPAVIAVLRASPADDRVFQQVMSNDYRRLRERSPNLEDHEINVFEAAFLTLMRDAATHPGALAIYVEEILGTKMVPDNEKVHALKNTIQVRTLFLNLTVNSSPSQSSPHHNPHHLPRNFVPSVQEANVGQHIFNSIHHPAPKAMIRKDSLPHHQSHRLHTYDGSTDANSTGAMDDPRLTELLAVYREAKSHFKGTEQNTEVYFTLARILCTKATDCIQYMMKVKAGDARLVELRDTLERVSSGGTWEAQGTKRRREYDRDDSL